MLNKTQKSEIVAALVDRFKRQKIAIFSDFRGVSVAKSQALRGLLKKEDAEYKVAKKTLFDRALAETMAGVATKDMKGEIGVAFGYGDEVLPAKILAKFGKENVTFKILGGLLDGKFLSDTQVLALARLPSREALLAQVAGVLAGPVHSLARALQANIRNFAYALGQIRDNKNK